MWGRTGLPSGAAQCYKFRVTTFLMDERRLDALLLLTVLGSIAVVAIADSRVETVSLGFLYILPLSLSALLYRLRWTLLLIPVCVALHDWLGPYEHVGWPMVARNLLTAAGFSTGVLFVNQLAAQRRRLSQLVRDQRDALEAEIRNAAEVQQRLLPRESPQIEGFDVAGRVMPARLVGGDYYDYIQLPGGSLGLVIADVSGKGVAAALLMPSVEMALRMGAAEHLHSDEMVTRLDKLLLELTDPGRYVTLFYAKLDIQRRVLEYTNAGHCPPLLIRSDGEEIWLTEGGTVVGLLPRASFTRGMVELRSGDVLVFYTDGVTETENETGLQFSTERLLSLVRASHGQSATQLVEAIFAAAAGFASSQELRDDVTAVVLKAL